MGTSTKLTLSVDSDIVRDAKEYASEHSHSLSNLVENYFRSLIKQKSHPQPGTHDSVTPLVAELQTLVSFDKAQATFKAQSTARKKLHAVQSVGAAQSDRQIMTDHILDKYTA
jgi:hypothetical protein